MFRYALSRRWIPWHLFCAALVVVMVVAGIWQWSVAFDSVDANGEPSLNVRNLVCASVVGICCVWGVVWFRFLRDQRDAELADMVAAADVAVEQVADLSGSASTESAQASAAPELISLDDSAERRRHAPATFEMATNQRRQASLGWKVSANDRCTSALPSDGMGYRSFPTSSRSGRSWDMPFSAMAMAVRSPPCIHSCGPATVGSTSSI